MPAEKAYIHYLSFLKCIGMFAVIGIHVFCTTVYQYEQSYSNAELFAAYFLTNVLRMWAVPVFVMISGALFLNPEKKIPLKKLYSKYILRLVLVLLTFGFLYAMMELVFDARTFRPSMLLTAWKNVYSGNLWDHMWFVYMILGLYMTVPVFQRLTVSLDDALLRYFLLLLLSFACIFPMAQKASGVKFGVYIPCASIWLFYYFLGYALHFEKIKISEKCAIAFILLGVLWCIFAQSIPSSRNPYGAGLLFSGTDDIFGVLMSAGIFALAKAKCAAEKNALDTVINPLSFGVYIIHALFINFFYKALQLTPETFRVPLMWALVFICTAVFSLTTVWIFRKIPFVRRFIL